MTNNWTLKSKEEMNGICQRAEKQLPIVQDSDKLESLAAFFRALSDETRLKIISLLVLEDLCMCEIVAALNGASSTISHHLRIMEKGGVIESRREGKFTIYSLQKDKIAFILPLLKS